MGIQTDPELTEWSSGRHFEFGLSPITRLLLDVFARNLAGGLNFTSYRLRQKILLLPLPEVF